MTIPGSPLILSCNDTDLVRAFLYPFILINMPEFHWIDFSTTGAIISRPIFSQSEADDIHRPFKCDRRKHRCLFHFSYSTSDVTQFVQPICISMLINSCLLSGLDVVRQSGMAGVIRLEGSAFLHSLPLLPSSHPKTDSRADTSKGIKLMWWQSHLPGAPTG